MQSDWAAENLQVIRTLMERSAIYRRALAPIMAALGVTGIAASTLGTFIQFKSARSFVTFWLIVGVIAVFEAFLLVRRQALKASESYWSPPTRRVAQAVIPSLFAGLVAGLTYLLVPQERLASLELLVAVWIILYGCAIHSAGFFMPRGMKLFGWGFVATGCLLGMYILLASHLSSPSPSQANLFMGGWFGAAHLAYSIYLYYTEKNRTEA